MTRFATAQDGPAPTSQQLADQRQIQQLVAHTAMQIEDRTKPSREQSLAITKLEEALMWAGKAIFQ